MLDIHIYSASGSNLGSSPSMESFSSLNSWGRKSFSFLSSAMKTRQSAYNPIHPPHISSREPASPRSIGQALGHFSIVIPSEHPFSKVTGRHPILYNKKQVGKIQIQMGLFLDVKYEPKPVNICNLL